MLALVLLTAFAVWLGKVGTNSWVNPFSFYSAVWGVVLTLYEARLIQYYDVSFHAWFCIFLAWGMLYFGGLLGWLLVPPFPRKKIDLDAGKAQKAILFLCAIAAVGIIQESFVLRHEFGGVLTAIIENAGDIYAERTGGGLGYLPYTATVLLPAACLAGCYFGVTGKFKWFCAVPFVLLTINSFFVMGRGTMGIAGLLFLVCYWYTRSKERSRMALKKRLALSIAPILLFSGFMTISSIRHLEVDFPGSTPQLEAISAYFPPFPSIYANFSATPVAFSMYLDKPEPGMWGQYTFAPIYRLLAKIGLPTNVPPYEENYWTPVPMNTSTYLKNLHSDFGLLGVAIVPFFLGLAAFMLMQQTHKLWGVLCLAHLYVFVAFSLMYTITVLGEWYISLVVLTPAVVLWLNHRQPCPAVQS